MKLKRVIKNGAAMWCADMGLWQGKRERFYRASKEEAQKLMSDRRERMRQEGNRVFNLSNQEIAKLHAADVRAKAAGFASVNECVELCIAGKLDRLEKMPVVDAIKECIASKKQTGKRPSYIRKFSSHLHGFKTQVEECECHVITRSQIEKWAWAGRDREGKPTKVQPVSAKSRITDIGTFFSFCVKRKWCLKNPVDDIEPILLEDKPPGIHTVEQVQALMKSCLEHEDGRKVLCYVALNYFGGLRPAEALRLKPSDIGPLLINVEGAKSKTRQRRLIPINDTLRAWLAISSVPHVKNFQRDFERVKAAVPWSHDVMRHSFCSYALPKFGEVLTAAWAGHSVEMLISTYRERVKPDDVARYWSITPSSTSPPPYPPQSSRPESAAR